MKRTILSSALALTIALAAASCGSSDPYKELKKDGFQESEAGVLYKVVKSNDEGALIQEGEYIIGTLDMLYNDSIIDGTDGQSTPLMRAHESTNRLDVAGCIMGRHVGETIKIAILADSMAANVPAQYMPPMYQEGNGDVVYYDITIDQSLSEEAFNALMESEKAAMKQASEEALKQYISENNITVKPSATGLYRIITKKGNGAKVVNGSSVNVHYTGHFFDGTVFDSSEGHAPISLTVGSHGVIDGWEEGLLGLNEGTKATLIIPYQLAYGENGNQVIPPFSNLVFEIEIVSVK